MKTETKVTNRVNDFMNSVREFLISKYGKIEASWSCGLLLLEDSYTMFLFAQADIAENGLFLTNRFGDRVKNDSIKIKLDAQVQIIKLLNEFGLTAYANGKIKQTSDDDSTQEILNNLLGE